MIWMERMVWEGGRERDLKHTAPLVVMAGNLFTNWIFFFLALYFVMISDLQKRCEISTKNSHLLFTQIPHMVTFYHICAFNS